MKINAGIIQWFNSEKRFGVITSDKNEDYFIHKSNIYNDIDEINPGDFFVFEPGFENNKNAALLLRKLKEKGEFEFAITEFFNKPKVELHIEVKKAASYGRQIVVKEMREYNFFSLAADSFFEEIKYEEQFELFVFFFDLLLSIHGSTDTFEYFDLTYKKYKRFNLTNDESAKNLFSIYLSRLDDFGKFKVWQGYNEKLDFQKRGFLSRHGRRHIEEFPFPSILIDFE
ncbi:MAG: cold shock domain-containing protein [Weeksellaceae bacterium]|nr:cold shock domain-containing protein [Weeksellaceae bacterium]